MDNPDDQRTATIELAQAIMSSFGRTMDDWYDHLHDDVVLEFPFGRTVPMPARVEGKAAATEFFAGVLALGDLRFDDIRVEPLLDPHRVIVEYSADVELQGVQYEQRYLCVQEYRDGKLIQYTNISTVWRSASSTTGSIEKRRDTSPRRHPRCADHRTATLTPRPGSPRVHPAPFAAVRSRVAGDEVARTEGHRR